MVPLDIPGKLLRANILTDEILIDALDRVAQAAGQNGSSYLADAARQLFACFGMYHASPHVGCLAASWVLRQSTGSYAKPPATVAVSAVAGGTPAVPGNSIARQTH
ncbi:MAG TPA: hypothetical protein VMF67_17460 [Rhizomicrobium sp.]|nr:hypothetical protein [Rhizomicrobium sp.]